MSDQLKYLFDLDQFGIKFGLENILALVASLNHPQLAYRTVHIAGTNGKGSVTAMIDAALRAAGRRSARYTSPHLVDIRERFVIDGMPVSADALDGAIADVRVHIDRLIASGTLAVQPTFFEVTTAVAFELFRRARVEDAVVEVGLGGRLDATNVVRPAATAITSIDFDHEQYLGSTLREIAREKAGIIKRGVPVVVGDMDREALNVIADVAGARGAPLIRASEGVDASPLASASSAGRFVRLRTRLRDYGAIELALAGNHQVGNAIVAVRILEALDVPAIAIVEGLRRVSWPGRLELRRFAAGREALFDAAHNPAGAEALASYLKTLRGETPALVFAAMRDKDVDRMFGTLLPHVAAMVATRASTRRAADPQLLAERARAVRPDLPVLVEVSPHDAMAAAWRISRRIVVAGSIFLLGDVMRDLETT